MKKVIITQSNYIPWKGYFDAINTADQFIIYDDMQYTKRDWRNRNKIKTKDGLLWLSVPVEVKGKYFQKINETVVSEADWGKTHWKTIHANYSKAPYYKLYKDFFEEFYMNNDKKFLTDINYTLITIVNKLLSISTEISFSSDFELVEGKTEKLVDLCKKVGATDYYSGPAAQNYMDESLFEAESVKVHYFDYSGYPVYQQLHGDFAHDVSILDLLFNEGENAKNFMKSFK
jgi:hypothetical protein